MGSLTLPERGTVYLDAQILIYSVERHPRYAERLRALWNAVDEERLRVYSSELTYLETLVLPLRRGDSQLISDYESFLEKAMTALLPISRNILLEAARLRASLSSLRTPDALHAASALSAGLDAFLTNDHAFLKVPGLNVVLLDQLP